MAASAHERCRIAGIVVMTVALHIAVLSMVFWLRHIGYIMTATLSATLIWGGVYFLNEQKRRMGFIAGVVVSLAVQQAAYHVWKTELPGFWWPLAQFGALQILVAFGLGRTVA